MITGDFARRQRLKFDHFLMSWHRNRTVEFECFPIEKDVIDDRVETDYVVRVRVIRVRFQFDRRSVIELFDQRSIG
jgi:hypothetical protein